MQKAVLLETYQTLKKQQLSQCASWPQKVTDAPTPGLLLTKINQSPCPSLAQKGRFID
jgi:hypothetical protein